MKKIIIVYASMTGNTEEMAEEIAAGIRAAGIEPDLKSVLDASAVDLLKYDGILLGAYTWGDGDLPDEFLDFHEEMDDVDLDGRTAAAFGSADSSYRLFGAAVDQLVEKLQERGAYVALEGMKVELFPSEEDKEECRGFGRRFAESVLHS
ncbi:flavodoxin [Paenibacillus thalictri]|uniref:Flavodoxin n=1 Tax=Paenibacillus thalictri TaxID=2527873 RepID=A0A4Q9DJZ9_9BACL|nr:flavodoxin [Paenibacillus thalictri]TBL72382.1 flavodoxin [Paenibacillus thalictri]